MLLTLCPWQITTSSSLLSDNKTHNGPLLSCSQLRQSRDCFNQDRVPDNMLMASLPTTALLQPPLIITHSIFTRMNANWRRVLNNPAIKCFIDPMCSSLIGSWSLKCGIVTLKYENCKCLAFNESKDEAFIFLFNCLETNHTCLISNILCVFLWRHFICSTAK